MRIEVGNKHRRGDIATIHRLALVHRKGRTYVFGAETNTHEVNSMRMQIPYKIAFNRNDERWWIGDHVSQAITIGESVVTFIAYFKDRPETLFFTYEDYGMTNPEHFQIIEENVAMYDVTTPDNFMVMGHNSTIKLEDFLQAVFPEDFVTVATVEEATISVERDPGDPSPLTEDCSPSEPEEIEPEWDELPSVLRKADTPIIEAMLAEAALDTSMATVDESVPTAREFIASTIHLQNDFSQRMKDQSAIVGEIKRAYPNSFVEVMIVRQLVTRYRDMLRVDSSSHLDLTAERFGPNTSVSHVHRMLNILESDFTQSVTKKHRWLGFIQAMLIVYGYTTVERERNYTRDIFRGQ